MLMSHICKRFEKGLKPYTINELRNVTQVPIRIVNDLIYEMVDAGLLVELSPDEKGDVSRFMPAQSLDQLSMGMLIDRLESKGKWKIDLPLTEHYSEQWKRVLENRSAYLRASREVLLKDL